PRRSLGQIEQLIAFSTRWGWSRNTRSSRYSAPQTVPRRSLGQIEQLIAFSTRWGWSRNTRSSRYSAP
ncbi:hypothetical protein CKF46_37890, partial [Klebsiella pneumoniae]